MLVSQLLEDEVDTSREEPDEHLGVKEESRPGSRLVLGDRGNNGNVDLGVAGIPEGVESAGPGSNDTRDSETHEASEGNSNETHQRQTDGVLELLGGDLALDVVGKSGQLNQSKDT